MKESALQETCEPELVSCPQTTPMPSPTAISNGQQGSANQQLTETNEYEPKDSNTGRRTSGRVRKRTQVDGRCECDTEITNEEKEMGTQVMRCKARGCETGWVRTSSYSCLASGVLMGDTQFHIACMDYQFVPRNWTCPSCRSNSTKRRR